MHESGPAKRFFYGYFVFTFVSVLLWAGMAGIGAVGEGGGTQ